MGETDAGVYELTFTSYVATTYGVYILDEDTGEIYSTEASFGAGDVESMDILNVTYPFENEDHGARFEVVLRDAYGNVVKTLDESDLSFDSTLGEVFASLDEESGVWDVSLYSSEVGEATVTVEGGSYFDDLSESVEFFFDSVMLGIPRGVEEGEEITVPVYINMGEEGSLAEYDVSIVYNSAYLQFEEATEGSDDFMGSPTVSLTDGIIRIDGETSTGEETDQYVHVADLFFTGAMVGDGTIYAEDATITNTNEVPVENPVLLQAAAVPAVVVKGTKEVCVDVFSLEGADDMDRTPLVSADIFADFTMVEAAYAAAAAACNCPYFLKFDVNLQEFARDEWIEGTDGSGTDGAVEDDVIERVEASELADTFGRAGCIPIFYVPQYIVSDAAAGRTVVTGSSSGQGEHSRIVVDKSRDDTTTLLHELMHMLSDNAIKDYDKNESEEENAESIAQGGKDPKNVMNYGDPGAEMTAAQCALIEWDDWPTK